MSSSIIAILITLVCSKYVFQFSSGLFYILSLASLLPLIAVFWVNFSLVGTITKTIMISGWIMATFLFKSDDQRFSEGLSQHILKLEKEIKDVQKYEFLARSFPEHMVPIAEKLFQPIVVENAVIGFTDLVNSTKISEALDVKSDWNFMDMFTRLTVALAKENDIVITNHTGDGVLFIANFDGSEDWPVRVHTFFDVLQAQVTQLVDEWSDRLCGIESGVKIGLYRGSAVMGNLGDHGFYTAKGFSVNLASRLCDLSEPKEICLCADLWTQHLEDSFEGWNHRVENSIKLKGISEKMNIVRLQAPSVKANVLPNVEPS